MTDYELVYFELNGRAGGIRLMLDYLQIPFIDTRFPRTEFPKIKETFKFKQVPVLNVKSKNLQIPQTIAILRYLATKHGCLGINSEDNALIDAYAEQIQDTIIDIRPWIWSHTRGSSKDEQDKACKEVLFPKLKDSFVPIFFEQLNSNNTGYLVGNQVSWVDFMLADLVDRLEKLIPTESKDIIEPLIEHRNKIFALPNIEKCLEDRRKYLF